MRVLLVGVSSDLIIHHHTVNQTLGQQARVLLSQLQSAQPAQVLALKRNAQVKSSALHVSPSDVMSTLLLRSAYEPGSRSLVCFSIAVSPLNHPVLPTHTPTG